MQSVSDGALYDEQIEQNLKDMGVNLWARDAIRFDYSKCDKDLEISKFNVVTRV